jgi:endothelin-converting enzyme/putative endopeptidase
MYKSTTDQGKAINLFNSILDTVARDSRILLLRPYLAKLIRSKHQRLAKLLIEMEPIGGIGFGVGVVLMIK